MVKTELPKHRSYKDGRGNRTYKCTHCSYKTNNWSTADRHHNTHLRNHTSLLIRSLWQEFKRKKNRNKQERCLTWDRRMRSDHIKSHRCHKDTEWASHIKQKISEMQINAKNQINPEDPMAPCEWQETQGRPPETGDTPKTAEDPIEGE